MATRLTTFSKLLITLLILGAIVAGGYYLLYKTEFGRELRNQATDQQRTGERTSETGVNLAADDDVLNVQLVTWGGYAPSPGKRA